MTGVWMWAAAALVLTLVPCGVAVFRGTRGDRLAGLEAATAIATLVIIVLAEGFRRDIFLDLALALALLSFGGGLVFARFVERWL